MSTPIVVGNYVYFLNRDGTVSCFDAGTGIPIFTEHLEVGGDASQAPPPAEAEDPAEPEEKPAVNFSASPVASNGLLYLASEAGEIHVVRAGAFLTVEATHQVGEAIFATPAISDGMLLVRAQRHLFAFSR